MDTEEKIMMLLHGDMENEADVLDLAHILVNSTDNRRLLLQHIRSSRELARIAKRIIPPASAATGVLSLIASQEAMIEENKSDERATRQWFPSLPFTGWIVLFLTGLLIGALIPSPIRIGEAWLLPRTVKSFALHDRNHDSSEMADDDAAIDRVAGSTASSLFNKNIPSDGTLHDHPIDVIPHQQTNHDSLMGIRSPLITSTASALASTISIFGQVHVLAPNGGEEFNVGDAIPIVWTGVPSDKPARVQFSSDNGNTWNIIADSAFDGYLRWRVPDVRADSECLIKVAVNQIEDPGLELVRTIGRGQYDVSWAEFSPDGTLLAASTRNGKLVLWKTDSWTVDRVINTPDSITLQVQFSPDGAFAVAVSLNGITRVWNLKTGSLERVIDSDTKSRAWFAAFSPTGQTIAVGYDDGSIKLWDPWTGALIATYRVHTEAIRYLTYTPDGTKLLAASTDRTGSIIDLTTGRLLRTFVHHPKDVHNPSAIVNAIALSPDGSVVVTGGFDGDTKFWDATTGTLLMTRQYHGGRGVSKLYFSPDGRWIVSMGYDGKGVLIDPKNGNILGVADVGYPGAFTASFRQDVKYMALCHGADAITIWNLPSTLGDDVSDAPWSVTRCDVSDVSSKEEKLGDKKLNLE